MQQRRFNQKHKGIPVSKNQIVIKITRNNEVTAVTNGYKAVKESIPVQPAFSKKYATKLAKSYLKTSGKMNFFSAQLEVHQNGVRDILAWVILMEPERPLGDWKVVVDATTGKIIVVKELTSYFTGPGSGPFNGTCDVFLPDPISRAHATYGVGGFTDNGDLTNADLDFQLFDMTLMEISQNIFGDYELNGPYAKISDFELPFDGLHTSSTLDFSTTREGNSFEAVMCYYYIDKSLRYINNTLGVNLVNFHNSGEGTNFDPHGLDGADQSHYLSLAGRIAFGEGGVDDAEDADVIIHELGHGIHDWITNGNASTVEGLGEGSGDYWAQSLSQEFNLYKKWEAENGWVFNWDGHNEYWVEGRTTKYPNPYPGGLVGQIHSDGQIWASSLMKIYDDLGRIKTDRIFLEGLMMTDVSSSQEDAAQMVYQAAIDLGYSNDDLCIIYHHFTTTGYMIAPVPSGGTMEIYGQDTPFDLGTEPNPDNGVLWDSQDIWVRNTDDHLFEHQNPEFSMAAPNAVYVKVRNLGCNPVSDAQLHVYWSKAATGSVWPTNWNDYYPFGPLLCYGDEITTIPLDIPILEPGEERILEVDWFPPNPALYPDGKHHFCLLARIVSPVQDPISTVETQDLYSNTKNNNNIFWKNVTVVNDVPGVWVHVNVLDATPYSTPTKLEFNLGQNVNPDFLSNGTLQLKLEGALKQIWESGGSLGSGLQTTSEGFLNILSPDFVISNLNLTKNQLYRIGVRYLPNDSGQRNFSFNLIQKQNGRTIGGERFVYQITSSPSSQNGASAERSNLKGKDVKQYDNSFIVTPNPFKSGFDLIVPPIQDTEKYSVSLYSFYGQLLQAREYIGVQIGKDSRIPLSLSDKPSGYYFLKIVSPDGRIISKKLIKSN